MERIESVLKKYPLVGIMLILCFISCFAVMNASPIISNQTSPYTLWTKQLAFYAIGGLMAFVIYRIGMESLYNHINILYWIFMVFLFGLALDNIAYTKILHIHIVPFTKYVNGATSWYSFPGLSFFSFQPSEFMKIIIVMALAKMTQEYNANVLIRTTDSEIKYIIEVMKISIPPAVLVLLENDSGVMMILMAGVFFVLLSSGLRRQWFVFVLGIAVAGIALLAYLFIYQNGIFTSIIKGHTLSRVYGWLDPEGTTSDQGLQLWYSMLSYGTAGWLGHGFQAAIKAFPEAQTDFIFAVIATDYGYVGALVTLAAVVGLDVILLRIGLSADNMRDKIFVMGVFGCLVFQQIWNIGMVLGLFPITGITLPFISYGGSSLLSYMFALGIFMDIDYTNKITDLNKRKF